MLSVKRRDGPVLGEGDIHMTSVCWRTGGHIRHLIKHDTLSLCVLDDVLDVYWMMTIVTRLFLSDDACVLCN